MTRNYGVFCFVEECSNFEKADFFLRSTDGDFLSSDSFVKGTCNAVAAGRGDDRPLVSSCFTAVRWTGSLVLLLMPLQAVVIVPSVLHTKHTTAACTCFGLVKSGQKTKCFHMSTH